MSSTLDKIKIGLNKFLTYDWIMFNSIEMFEQSKIWEQLKNEFETLVNEIYSREKFDFEKTYALINLYHDKFVDLPIEGKLYVVVNKRLLRGQLLNIIRDIEYQEVKKIENPACDCQILSRFNKTPEINNLKEVGIIKDGYYMPKLFICNNCGFEWRSYISDDSVGRTVFEKHDPKDNNSVEYYEK